MKMRLLLVGAVLAWTAFGRAAADEPVTLSAKDLAPQTDWYGVYLKDPQMKANKKMGYCKIWREQENDVVRESFQLSMKLTSFGKRVELTMKQTMTFEAKPPYRMVRAEFSQGDGTDVDRRTLVRKDGKFELTHEAGGETKVKEVGAIEYTLADSTAVERWLRTGPKLGAELTSKDFSMVELTIDPQKSTVKSHKTALAKGVEVKFYEVETVSKQLTMLSRYDDQGRMLSGKFAVFDIQLEPEEQAKNTQFSQDLFILGMVKLDRPLGVKKIGEVRELVVEVTGLGEATFEAGPRQAVVPGKEKGAATLKLGKKHGKSEKVDAKAIEENLKETLAYPITHPKIQALAKKAVGDAATPEEKVKRIVEFVHNYVEGSLSTSVPNIHDLIVRKKGDCKSYALLTVNLARASGIPAREVSGLLYVGDDIRSFGGHAWNEVILNGVWVPIDSTFNESEVDATHISFGPQNTAARGLLETLGRLSFRLVEVKTGE